MQYRQSNYYYQHACAESAHVATIIQALLRWIDHTHHFVHLYTSWSQKNRALS